MDSTTADEIERLKAVENEAERRHGEAMNRGDLEAARIAADHWIKASDALTEYLEKHTRTRDIG